MIFYTYFFGDEISVLVVYMLMLLPALSISLAIWSKKNLVVSIKIDNKRTVVERGDVEEMLISLKNKSFIPIPNLLISFIISPNMPLLAPSKQTISLGPLKTCNVILKYKAKYRGVARIGIKDIELKDFLGLYSSSILDTLEENKGARQLKVLNRIVDLKINALFLLDSTSIDGSKSETKPKDLNFLNFISGEPGYEFREYQPGDPMHRIHWKIFAKGGTLMVREDERNNVSRKRLLLDPLISKSGESQKRGRVQREDKVLECLISVAYMLVRAGRDIEVWLLEGGVWVKYPIESRDGVLKLQHALAAYTFINSDADCMVNERFPVLFDEFSSKRGKDNIVGKNAVIFTALPDDEAINHIGRIREMGIKIDLVIVSGKDYYDDGGIGYSKEQGASTWLIEPDRDISEVLS
ncbi:MAG: DUF58 domain-containing protein [Clostridium sp.]|nr:DUF58 domain-containing protein [Clostridium sp.]